MFCMCCGHSVPDEAVFCPFCGQSLTYVSNDGKNMLEHDAQEYEVQTVVRPSARPLLDGIATHLPATAYTMTDAIPVDTGIVPPRRDPTGAQPVRVPMDTYPPAPIIDDATQPSTKPSVGMKWYYILIYLYFWVNIGLCALNAFSLLAYDESYYSWMTAISPMARAFDVTAALGYIALAAYGVFVRFRLRGYKKDAPLHTIVFGAVRTVPPLIRMIGIGLSNLASTGLADCVTTIVIVAIWRCANKSYFDKRSNLFVNE